MVELIWPGLPLTSQEFSRRGVARLKEQEKHGPPEDKDSNDEENQGTAPTISNRPLPS